MAQEYLSKWNFQCPFNPTIALNTPFPHPHRLSVITSEEQLAKIWKRDQLVIWRKEKKKKRDEGYFNIQKGNWVEVQLCSHAEREGGNLSL